MELVNLKYKVQEYTEERKDVLNCDATDLQYLKEESPDVALLKSNDKVRDYAEEQKDTIDHQVLTRKDLPAVRLGNLIDEVQLFMEQQKDDLTCDATDDQILNDKESPAVGLAISNDKVDDQKDASVFCTSASENRTVNLSRETVTAEDENWKSSEGSVSKNNGKVGVNTAEFVSVSSKVSQPPLVDAIIGVKNVVAQESEKPSIKEPKQNVYWGERNRSWICKKSRIILWFIHDSYTTTCSTGWPWSCCPTIGTCSPSGSAASCKWNSISSTKPAC